MGRHKKIIVQCGQNEWHLIEDTICCIAMCGAGVGKAEIIHEKIPDSLICETCLKKHKEKSPCRQK